MSPKTRWWLNFFSGVLLFAALNWIALHFAIGSILAHSWSQPATADILFRALPYALTPALLIIAIIRLIYRSNDSFAWSIVVCCVALIYYYLWTTDL